MSAPPSLDPLAGYQPLGRLHDELLDAHGNVREHWTHIGKAFQDIGLGELGRRHDEIQRLLEQDGVTYNITGNVTGEAGGERSSRPWMLDPIPFVVPTDEWSRIERGMVQRAEILDLVLTDLYGERRLLRSGLVPPAMVLADPQFLRACDDIVLPGSRQLVVLATDLARGADGTWLTLSHRAQAPSGAAYALENRRVLSRTFPQLLRNADVRGLTAFIPALRIALQAAAPIGVDDPSIVILSPGSLSETAFEHASMAAQLGYPLVQGSDFEVRNGRIGLRTVGGWSPVHVILRRVDAEFCDPLALRSDSTLGIAGLVDACRAGTVSVVNTLGSGVLENAGLGALMPVLAQHLLGSDLVLDQVPSWWCGDDLGRSHVLTNLGALVVRPLSRGTLQQSIDTTLSSASELAGLRAQILAEPEQWVGQERLTPGSTPVLMPAGVVARPTVLRSFVVADGESYVAMPGGLARTASTERVPITSRHGAGSKDIWVIGSDAERQIDGERGRGHAGSPATSHRPVHEPASVLPARAAEHFFWLGRYAERAESTVRLIRTVATRRDEFANAANGPGPAALTVLLEALTRITGTFPGFVGDDADRLFDDPTDELLSLVVENRRPGTVAHAVRRMFTALDVVRDQLSLDTWLVVGSLQRELERLESAEAHRGDGEGDGADRDEAMAVVLDELLQGLLSMSGLASESMVRDLGWHFMAAGRRIERAIQVTMLVGASLAGERSAPVERLVVESVLTAGESIITSRRRYRSRAEVSTTLELLFVDASNPRSLRFQIDRLTESLAHLDDDHPGGITSIAVHRLAALADLLTASDMAHLADIDERGHRTMLQAFVVTVRTELCALSDDIAAASFARHHSQYGLRGQIAESLVGDATQAIS